MVKLRPEVMAFAEAMERKLRENDWKEHWSGFNVSALCERLYEEYQELLIPATIDPCPEDAMGEAVDVGNFAMMIYDVSKRTGD